MDDRKAFRNYELLVLEGKVKTKAFVSGDKGVETRWRWHTSLLPPTKTCWLGIETFVILKTHPTHAIHALASPAPQLVHVPTLPTSRRWKAERQGRHTNAPTTPISIPATHDPVWPEHVNKVRSRLSILMQDAIL